MCLHHQGLVGDEADHTADEVGLIVVIVIQIGVIEAGVTVEALVLEG